MTEQKESSFQKTWDILQPFLIYFVVHDLAQVLLAFLLSASMGWFGDTYTDFVMKNAASVNGVLNAFALLIGMASVFPMAKKEFDMAAGKSDVVKQKSSAAKEETDGRRTGNEKVRDYLLLVIFAASLAMGINIVMTLLGLTDTSEAYQQVAMRQFGVSFGVGILVYGILSPLAEEIVFRGLIYNRMKRYFGVMLSVIVCGLLFGVYHGNLVQGIYGCILGIAITYMYQIYGNFLAPVLFHSVANISVFIAGYRQDILKELVTPLNCLLFLTLAVASFVWISKVVKK